MKKSPDKPKKPKRIGRPITGRTTSALTFSIPTELFDRFEKFRTDRELSRSQAGVMLLEAGLGKKGGR